MQTTKIASKSKSKLLLTKLMFKNKLKKHWLAFQVQTRKEKALNIVVINVITLVLANKKWLSANTMKKAY